ncbi:MAG: two-component sensor histidine kinase [marine bacterium B5-7]|nr:MAG: two-component sensor histidine kinase [marine bacterium B5-7]
MVGRAIARRLSGPGAAIALSAVLLATSFMFSSASQQEGLFGKHYTTLLAFNIGGVILLTAIIGANIWRLMRQFRAQILGSRLTLRLIATFSILSLLPIAVVYYFAIQFLSRGIDSWFDVRIDRALEDAKLLSQNSLAAINQDLLRQIRDQAVQISEVGSDIAVIRILEEFREQSDYSEMSLYNSNGSIIAASTEDPLALFPDSPDEYILARVNRGQEFSRIEPLNDDTLQLRIVIPLPRDGVSATQRYLQVLYPLPSRFSKLGTSIQTASEEYKKLQYLRAPLKLNFVLTLSIITLMTGLISLWIAIYSARRMTQPLRQLAEGTRSVADGDYQVRLAETSNDELGVLVRSFNDMTREIQSAQQQAAKSQQQAEQQRTYLETILAHLSSGVLSFDENTTLIKSNAGAEQILGVDLSSWIGMTPTEISADTPWIEPFFDAISREIEDDTWEWKRQIDLNLGGNRQTLIARGTKISGDRADFGGHVIVFEDVTELLHAQRSAAWGEVARRLAHEIKNPLTPIQLSTERIRHKYLDKVPSEDRGALDRATSTIANQVESMKLMVNAFSEYAQPVRTKSVPTDINRLVQDVAELHRTPDGPSIRLDLDTDIGEVRLDPVQFRQVFNNLIINSGDAMHGATDKPLITIITRQMDYAGRRWVEIGVKDNGPGFSDGILHRIFDPYVTTKKKGTGLGLAIVYRIIEEHGGRIHAENCTDGGATVSIRIPMDSDTADSKNVSTDFNPSTPGSRGTRLQPVPTITSDDKDRLVPGVSSAPRRADNS